MTALRGWWWLAGPAFLQPYTLALPLFYGLWNSLDAMLVAPFLPVYVSSPTVSVPFCCWGLIVMGLLSR